MFSSNNKINDLLKKYTLPDLANYIMPVRFYGSHISRINQKEFTLLSVIKVLVGLSAYFIKQLKIYFQSSNINNDKEKDLLILTPNVKYERFLCALIRNLPSNINYKVISLSKLNLFSSITIKTIKVPIRHLLLCYCQLIIYAIQTLFSNTKLFNNISNNLVQINKLVYTVVKLNQFFEKYKFKIYFSLAPSIDQHQIIEKIFGHNFIKTFAMRPDNSNYTNAHMTISTQNLFYKSDYEKKIYQNYKLDSKCNLLEGGSLNEPFENYLRPEQFIQAPILFIDTIDTNDEQRDESRSAFLLDLYGAISKYKITLFHKPHPGLSKKKMNQVTHYVAKSNAVILKVHSVHELLSKPYIVFAFNSTLMYDIIINRFPVYVISRYYNSDKHSEHEFTSSGIENINNINDMTRILHKLKNPYYCYDLINNAQRVQEWFILKYHIPNGVRRMISIMSDIN